MTIMVYDIDIYLYILGGVEKKEIVQSIVFTDSHRDLVEKARYLPLRWCDYHISSTFVIQ